ncbi:MAG: hypothetical protein ACK526_16665 [Planctomyces sp.]
MKASISLAVIVKWSRHSRQMTAVHLDLTNSMVLWGGVAATSDVNEFNNANDGTNRKVLRAFIAHRLGKTEPVSYLIHVHERQKRNGKLCNRNIRKLFGAHPSGKGRFCDLFERLPKQTLIFSDIIGDVTISIREQDRHGYGIASEPVLLTIMNGIETSMGAFRPQAFGGPLVIDANDLRYTVTPVKRDTVSTDMVEVDCVEEHGQMPLMSSHFGSAPGPAADTTTGQVDATLTGGRLIAGRTNPASLVAPHADATGRRLRSTPLTEDCRGEPKQSAPVASVTGNTAVSGQESGRSPSHDFAQKIFVPVGYHDVFYRDAVYSLSLLCDKVYLFAPSKHGAIAGGVSHDDVLDLALAEDPAIVPIAFNRWYTDEKYRTELAGRIRKEQGETEAIKVLHSPDFDEPLQRVYQDASFGFLAENISSHEEQESLVESLITPEFCKVLALAASNVKCPPELERQRPAPGTSPENGEAWWQFAKTFLSIYLGDVGVSLKFGANASHSLPEWRDLYAIAGNHLQEQSFHAGQAFGTEIENDSEDLESVWKHSQATEFMNRIIDLPKMVGRVWEINEIRLRGEHVKFRNWLSRYCRGPQFRSAGITDEGIYQTIERELRVTTLAAKNAVRSCVVNSTPDRMAFSFAASVIAARDRGGSLSFDRTKILSGSLMNEERAHQLLPKYQGREFVLTYPFNWGHAEQR